MVGLGLLWFQYVVVSAAILYAGAKVVKHVDQIADRTRWSRAWLGLTVLASVTALPELITGVSAIVLYDVPDIAVGDVFGSCVFNLLVLVLLDWSSGRSSVYALATDRLMRPTLWSFALIAVAAGSLYLGGWIQSVAGVSLASVVLVVMYVIAVRHSRGSHVDIESVRDAEGPSLARLWVRFARDAAVVVAAAAYLPSLGQEIAFQTGIATTFIGNFLVAASTSLPELVTAFSALRRGSADLAIGDLIGSNMFDVAILAINDLAYTEGSLFAVVSARHLFSAVAALFMTLVVSLALRLQPRKHWRLSWPSWALVAAYVTAFWSFLRF